MALYSGVPLVKISCAKRQWREDAASALAQGKDVDLTYFLPQSDTKDCEELAKKYNVLFIPDAGATTASFRRRKKNPQAGNE